MTSDLNKQKYEEFLMPKRTSELWQTHVWNILIDASKQGEALTVEHIVSKLRVDFASDMLPEALKRQVQSTLKELLHKFDQHFIPSKIGRARAYQIDASIADSPFGAVTLDDIRTLQNALNLVKSIDSQFDAQPLWGRLAQQLGKSGFKLDEYKDILFFDGRYGYSTNLHLVGPLCERVKAQQAIKFLYKPFTEQAPFEVQLLPCQIREYNRRFYVCGLHIAGIEKASQGEVVNLGLDRIVGYSEKEWIKSTSADGVEASSFESDYYDDLIGLTVEPGNVETVVLAIEEDFYPYMVTKPFHPSQKAYTAKSVKVEVPKGWKALEYKLRVNRELVNNVLHLGSKCVVLAPANLKDRVKEHVRQMAALYGTSPAREASVHPVANKI